MTVDVANAPHTDAHDGVVWRSSAQRALTCLHDLLGINLDKKKRKFAGHQNPLLGVHCDLSAFAASAQVTFAPTDSRVADILEQLEESFGGLTPHTAKVIQGRLAFLFSSAYGSVGRAALGTLVDVANQPHSNPVWSAALERAYHFLRTLLPTIPPLHFDFTRRQRDKLVIYTDASYSAAYQGLGMVIFDTHTAQHFWCRVPAIPGSLMRHFNQELQTKINQLELLAVLTAVLTFAPLMHNRQIVFMCDNTAALSACVHGYARSPDMADLSNMLHLALAGLRASPWFEWVPSAANPADLPSRPPSDEEVEFYAAMHVSASPFPVRLPTVLELANLTVNIARDATSAQANA